MCGVDAVHIGGRRGLHQQGDQHLVVFKGTSSMRLTRAWVAAGRVATAALRSAPGKEGRAERGQSVPGGGPMVELPQRATLSGARSPSCISNSTK